jgi:predicted nuclease of predicted toxin-antitoxin system
VKAFLDQGLPYSTVKYLQPAGWDIIHTVDVNIERATDRAIIEYAGEVGRFCVTLDSDFHSIIAVDNAKDPSVIRIRQEYLKGVDVANLLMRIYPAIAKDLEVGALV